MMLLFKRASPSLLASLQVYCFSADHVTRNIKKLEALYIIRGQRFGLTHPVLHLRALCSGFHMTSSWPRPLFMPLRTLLLDHELDLTHHDSYGAEV